MVIANAVVLMSFDDDKSQRGLECRIAGDELH